MRRTMDVHATDHGRPCDGPWTSMRRTMTYLLTWSRYISVLSSSDPVGIQERGGRPGGRPAGLWTARPPWTEMPVACQTSPHDPIPHPYQLRSRCLPGDRRMRDHPAGGSAMHHPSCAARRHRPPHGCDRARPRRRLAGLPRCHLPAEGCHAQRRRLDCCCDRRARCMGRCSRRPAGHDRAARRSARLHRRAGARPGDALRGVLSAGGYPLERRTPRPARRLARPPAPLMGIAMVAAMSSEVGDLTHARHTAIARPRPYARSGAARSALACARWPSGR